MASQLYYPTGERYILNRGGAATGYVPDGIGRLAYLVDDLPGTARVSWTFGRNPAGQIASAARDNDGYAWTRHYGVVRAYTSNGLNQYVATVSALGNAGYGYDLNGNLTSEPAPAQAGGSRTFAYDVENRLVGASGGVTLSYDPLGRLFQAGGGSSDVVTYLYDGDALVAEYNPSGTLLRRYVHGAGVDEPLLWYEGAAVSWQNRRQLFADAQGSIVARTDAWGTSAALNAYDEYGIPAAANSGRFQYTGQIWLPELGMYHYKARVYSPSLGRFLQTDSIGYRGGINLYAYVGNDPVNGTDPSGTVRCAGDSRCPAVHAQAAQARAMARAANAQLRDLARAVRRGTELTADQQVLMTAFRQKFGARSATVGNLNAAASHFDRVADRIGAEGSGMRVGFSNTLNADPASAPINGNTMILGLRFFGQDGGLNGATQAYVIFHEGGHSAGMDDLLLPANAPGGIGRPLRGGQGAYGVSATNWLGANAPGMAARNNENYTCLVVPACGGP